MRSLISGVVGIVMGGLILLATFLRGGPQGEGAYRAGQIGGVLFALLCLVAGVYYFVKGINELGQPPERPRKRRKRPRDDDED